MGASNYRPICDSWILARAKLKEGQTYYGAYPGGFLQRARDLLGISWVDPILHVCSGMVSYYPYDGLGPNDLTMDLDPECQPNILWDVRKPFPSYAEYLNWLKSNSPTTGPYDPLTDLTDPLVGVEPTNPFSRDHGTGGVPYGYRAILADAPYSPEDASHYRVGAEVYPSPNLLLKNCLCAVQPWGKVGFLHYRAPRPPSPASVGFETRFVASISVMVGFDNSLRHYSVYERKG